MNSLAIYTIQADGSIQERRTHTRGQRMGVASVTHRARRDALLHHLHVVLCGLGILFCTFGIVFILSVCIAVALGKS